jgi:lysozyme
MKSELVRQLRGDESVEPCVYKDSLGFWTIGIGRLLDKRKPNAGLRPVEMDVMMQNDIDERSTS